MVEFKITRVLPSNNIESEARLNELGREGYRIVAWASFNLDVVCILEREVQKPMLDKANAIAKAEANKAYVAATQGEPDKKKRQVTVTPEE